MNTMYTRNRVIADSVTSLKQLKLTSSNALQSTPHHTSCFLSPQIFAGGDVSMAAVSKEPGGAEDYCQPSSPSPRIPLRLEEEKINKLLAITEDDMIDDDLFSWVSVISFVLAHVSYLHAFLQYWIKFVMVSIFII